MYELKSETEPLIHERDHSHKAAVHDHLATVHPSSYCVVLLKCCCLRLIARALARSPLYTCAMSVMCSLTISAHRDVTVVTPARARVCK